MAVCPQHHLNLGRMLREDVAAAVVLRPSQASEGLLKHRSPGLTLEFPIQ